MIRVRKASEQALHRLNRELRAISTCKQTLLRATDEQSLIDEICRIVCEKAGYRMAWVGYAEHDEPRSVRRIAWAGHEDGYLAKAQIISAETERGRGPTGIAIRTGKTATTDFVADPSAAPWRVEALQRGYKSSIALPLKNELGTTFGSFTIYSPERNAFSRQEIQMLEELAADLAFGIVTLRTRAERKRAEQDVALLSHALDKVREAVLLVDEQGRICYVNEESCRVLGYTREELLAKRIPDVDPYFDHDFPAEWAEHWNDLRKKKWLSFERSHRVKDGHLIPVEISANYFEYGGKAYNLVLARDISERKQAEEERAAHLHLFESMARINLALQGKNDLELAMGDVLEEVLSIFECDRAFLIYLCEVDTPSVQVVMERTRPGYSIPKAFAGELLVEPSVVDSFKALLASNGPVGSGPGLEQPLPSNLVPFGVVSQICIALYPKGDKPYLFGLHQCSRARVWTSAEKRLLLPIGRRISDRLTTLLAYRNLRDSERRLGEAQRIAHLGSWDCDLTNNVITLSDEMLRIIGLPVQQAVRDLPPWREQWLQMVHPDDRERVTQALADALGNAAPYDLEYRILRASGEERIVRVIAEVIRDASGRPVRMLGTWQDITERVRAEEERARLKEHLQQTQKMEAVGHLAGGIAHDFNNVLGIIIGYSELVVRDPGVSEETRSRVEEVLNSAQRAASLTRRLLAFSRKLVLEPQVLSLNGVVEGLDKMLRRLLGDDIEVRTELDPNLAPVETDPCQMEQVLMNLCINARDAMPEGGRLTIETVNVDVDDQTRHVELFSMQPGQYVKVTVSDTGTGMDKQTLSRIFEPFFTTKAPEHGTGLGLATVYGIVKQSGGYVWADSKPGEGASFSVLVPQTTKKLEAGLREAAPQENLRGSETVLLVEDAAPLRALLRKVIEDFGYKVVEAEDGEQAIQVADQFEGDIPLLLTDVSMPRIGGSALAKMLLQKRPSMRILFMSGHTDDMIAPHGVLEAGAGFVQKPFTPEALLKKVRQLLTKSSRASSYDQQRRIT